MNNEIGVTISFNEYKALVEFKLNTTEQRIAGITEIANDRLDRIVELRGECNELKAEIESLKAQLRVYEPDEETKGDDDENG